MMKKIMKGLGKPISNMATKKHLNDLMTELKKKAVDTKRRLTNLEMEIYKNQETLNNYIKSNDEPIVKLKTKTEKFDNCIIAAKNTVKTLESQVTQLSGDIEELARNNRTQNAMIDKLEENDKMHKKRKCRISTSKRSGKRKC